MEVLKSLANAMGISFNVSMKYMVRSNKYVTTAYLDHMVKYDKICGPSHICTESRIQGK